MNPHTPDQVQKLREFLYARPSDIDRKMFNLNSLNVAYTTVHLTEETKPFNYAVEAFVVPREDGELATEADYEITVSDDVPEELQGLWAWHELHDFDIVGHEADDRCLTSEQELAFNMSSDPELYQRYISTRITFYEGLAEFIVKEFKDKGTESVYSPADLKGCYDAIAFLETQKASLEEVTPNDTSTSQDQRIAIPSLLASAILRRAELNEQARQKKEQEAADAEKKRKEKELEDKRLAPERELSQQRAMEFIELMRSHGHDAKVRAYVRGTKIIGQTIRGPSTSVVTTLLGKGWEIKTRQYVRKDTYEHSGSVGEWVPGIILLDSGKAYNIAAFRDTPPGEVHVFADVADPHTATPLDRPFTTDEGHQILANYIAERTNILTETSDQTKPSSTKKPN